jgi:hypothetical protein
MSMSALIRALGAAAGGVSKGMDDAEAAADRKRLRDQAEQDRAYTMSERARTTAERDRADTLRTDLTTAAAPVAVEQYQPAGPVMDGAAGPAGQAIPAVSRVQGRAFETPEAATVAAATANSPEAVAARQAGVVSRAGDPAAAQRLRTGSMQEQVAKLTLSGAERTELDARFNADLQSKVTSWDSLDKFISDSAGDGKGGATKYASIPTADGTKRTLNRIGADGTMTPTGQEFPNSAAGLEMAMAELSKLPAKDKLAHIHQKEQDRRQAARDASTAEYQSGMLKNASDRTAAGIEIAQMKADLAASKRSAAAGQQGPVWDDKADAFLLKNNTSTDPVTGQSRVDGMGMQFGKLVAMSSARMNGGDTTTALGVAYQADNKLRARATDASGNYDPAKHDELRRVALNDLYRQPAQPSTPAQVDSPVRAGPSAPAPRANAIPGQPGVVAPPAQPERPGMAARAAAAINDTMDEAAKTGLRLESIRARVLESYEGGKKLTKEELATAKEFGIVPLSS